MKEQQRAEAVVETVPEDPSRPDGATDIYLIFDGRRIAKRGKPGTLHAMTWMSLEPGVVVRDVPMPESESGGSWSSKSIMCVHTDKHRFRCHLISQIRCSVLFRAE
jgi:hypothetical protein